MIGQNSTNGIGNVTVRSKLSNKSDGTIATIFMMFYP